MSRKQIILSLGVLVVLAGLAAAWFSMGSGGMGLAAASAPGQALPITAMDKTMGNPKAPIQLVEYGAPTCSICAFFNTESFPRLKRDYIDTGKVFYVFRVFPLRPEDGAVENMARCLPEDKYFEFIDLLWRNQPKWDAAEYPGISDVHAALVQQGRIAGMTAEQVDQCIAGKAQDERINKQAADADARFHITGTPTFVINGEAQSAGAPPYERLAKLLDAALAATKK